MAYFDPTKQTDLIADASPWWLSAILAQKTTKRDDRRIVAYVIVWAMECLQIYLRGGKFTLYTDCKPV